MIQAPQRSHVLLVICLAAIAILGFLYWQSRHNKQTSSVQPTVIINGQHSLRVDLADTPAKQVKGLSGVTHLADDEGMYFILDPAIETSFWMKDMLMPIDIIWISHGRVLGVLDNVPQPDPNESDGQLPSYPAPVGTSEVLEVAAGRAAELGIGRGSTIELRR